jgi:hypothetical protein
MFLNEKTTGRQKIGRSKDAMRDEIDPISLNDIDDANEWLVGGLTDDDRVFWRFRFNLSEVSRAAGVDEPSYSSRSRDVGSSHSQPLHSTSRPSSSSVPRFNVTNDEDDGEEEDAPLENEAQVEEIVHGDSEDYDDYE